MTDLTDDREEWISGKKGIASFHRVSLTTVDKWVLRGCPVLQKGGRGRAWKFDLLEVAKWRYSPTDAETNDPDKMTPDRRLKFYQAEREKDELMAARRQLIPAQEVASGTAELLKAVTSTLETLPDVLQRDASIDGQAVARAREVIDVFRNELHAKLVSLNTEDV